MSFYLSNTFHLLPKLPINSINTTFYRCIFSPNVLGINEFKEAQKLVANLQTKEEIVKHLKKTLDNKKPNLYIEDIKNLMYLSSTHEDIQLLLNVIYEKSINDKKKLFSYKFDAQLMRLFYTLNKIDYALNAIKDEKFCKLLMGMQSILILCTKLYDDKRYDDVISVADILIKNKHFETNSQGIAFIPSDISTLIIASLYRINTVKAIKKLKTLLPILHNESSYLQGPAIAFGVLLAVNQRSYHLAYYIMKQFNYQTSVLALNLKVIIFAAENSPVKAYNLFNRIIKIAEISEFMYVFPLTLKYLRESIKKTSNKELLYEFEASKEYLKSINQILSDINLSDVLSKYPDLMYKNIIKVNKQMPNWLLLEETNSNFTKPTQIPHNEPIEANSTYNEHNNQVRFTNKPNRFNSNYREKKKIFENT